MDENVRHVEATAPGREHWRKAKMELVRTNDELFEIAEQSTRMAFGNLLGIRHDPQNPNERIDLALENITAAYCALQVLSGRAHGLPIPKEG